MNKPIRNMNREELIQHYSIKQYEGLSFIDIRKEMESKNLDLDLIKDVIWEIDHNILVLPKIEKEYKSEKKKNLILTFILILFSININAETLVFSIATDEDSFVFQKIDRDIINHL